MVLYHFNRYLLGLVSTYVCTCHRTEKFIIALANCVQSVSWILAEFYFNRGLQRLYTGTCIILQKTINGFLCLLIVFLKSKTYQLILKDVIKLNRNLRQLIEIKLLLAIRTEWYWLKSIYLIEAVFNLSSQQTVINDNRSS